jgi:hydroxymethylglutaryl-CoA reductase (NADPH)
MPAIPAFVLKKLYVRGSLRAEADGFALVLKNLIAPGTITGVARLDLDGEAVDLAQVDIIPPAGNARQASEISRQSPLQFPVGTSVKLSVTGETLEAGPHELVVRVVVKEVGPLDIPISDVLQ